MDSPSSISSGVVLEESFPKSCFDSCPKTDQGRGFCIDIGVFRIPFPCCLLSKIFLIDSLLGDFRLFDSLTGGFKLLLVLISRLSLVKGDFRLASGEIFSRLSEDKERGVQLVTFFSNGEFRSIFIFLSSIIGVVSPEVTLLNLPTFPTLSSRLIVGLSTKLSELHSSDVGDTNGVNVVGVTEPGRCWGKNPSKPSPKTCDEGISVNTGFVAALVFARFGLLFTKCWSCRLVLGKSVIESQFSLNLSGDLSFERLEMFGDSSKSGMWRKLKLSTITDLGLIASDDLFDLNSGVAWR